MNWDETWKLYLWSSSMVESGKIVPNRKIGQLSPLIPSRLNGLDWLIRIRHLLQGQILNLADFLLKTKLCRGKVLIENKGLKASKEPWTENITRPIIVSRSKMERDSSQRVWSRSHNVKGMQVLLHQIMFKNRDILGKTWNEQFKMLIRMLNKI